MQYALKSAMKKRILVLVEAKQSCNFWSKTKKKPKEVLLRDRRVVLALLFCPRVGGGAGFLRDIPLPGLGYPLRKGPGKEPGTGVPPSVNGQTPV